MRKMPGMRGEEEEHPASKSAVRKKKKKSVTCYNNIHDVLISLSSSSTHITK